MTKERMKCKCIYQKLREREKNYNYTELSAALDRTKISDQKPVFIISQTAKSLGINLDELVLSYYSTINIQISKINIIQTVHRFMVLVEELVGLTFFVGRVSLSSKRRMLSSFKVNIREQQQLCEKDVHKNLEDFVTDKAMNFMKIMELPYGFLEVDPASWNDRDDFKQA
uniref:Zinc finger protein 862like [Hydra vulgaris] n=1 Tax=Lepeophtheirus salmonis TaxID=72036 RepID=A0A0K2UQY4_LEPSM